MKRMLTLIIIAMAFLPALNAQDVITLKDGTDVNAKVLEVTTNEIKYKKNNNPNGPIFTVSKSDVLIIRYENGEKDVFAESQHKYNSTLNTTEPIVEGMKYIEYRKFYDTKNYRSQPTDPYSWGWAGVASAIIPGLGQCVVGEWGRGALFLLGNLSVDFLSLLLFAATFEYTDLGWITLAPGVAFGIWNICDAVHVAKVKNMYHQDIRSMRTTQLEYSVSPFVSIIPNTGNGCHPLAGLSLNLSF